MGNRKPGLLLTITTLILFLSACSQFNVSPIAIPHSTNAAATTAPIDRLTTPSQILPDFSATITGTATQTINIKLKKNCVDIVDKLGDMPEGSIVLKTNGDKSPLNLYNLRSQQNIDISKAYFNLAISSDFKRLAFIDSYHRLMIVDSNHQIIKSLPVASNWRGVIQWLDKDNLLIEKYQDDSDYHVPTTSVLFNPNTGEQKEYPFNYPNTSIVSFDIGGPLPSWGTFSRTLAVYNSEFTRVFYPGFGEGENQNDSMLVLWNLQTGEEVSRFYARPIGHEDGAPIWKQDGSSAIVGIYPRSRKYNETGYYVNVDDKLPYLGGFDLFEVKRDGKIKRLTFLTTQYIAREEAFTLSPDEKKIAFWLNTANEGKSQLAILDTLSEEITSFCLTRGDNSITPIWSPDGKYLIVTIDEGLFKIYLIDIQRYKALELPNKNNGIAMGWLQDIKK